VKILLLHQHFVPPDRAGAIRSYYLATALKNAGHRVVVLAAYPGKEKKEETREGITIVYLPVAYANEMGFWARAAAFLRFAWSAARAAVPHRDSDVCYAISTPLTIGLPALFLRFRYGIPFYFEVGDLWPEAPIQLGFIKNPVARAVLRFLEATLYHQARAVVALSVPIQAAVHLRAPGKTVYLIPNMADTEFYRPQAKPAVLCDKFSVHGKFVVSYTGALGYANGLDFLMECANACRKANASVHFLIAGDGAEKNRLKSLAQHLQLTNVTFLGALPRAGVHEVLQVTDAVLVSYRRERVLETGSPNKYFDGLAAGKLVVVNFGGWIRAEIEREACGLWVSPDHPAEFVKKIMPFLQDASLLQRYQKQARQLAETTYARPILSKKFASIFK